MSSKTKYRLKFMFQEVDLQVGEFTIGRSPSCNLTLEDPLVSRRHVRIMVNRPTVTIDDLGSRNGTLVNGEPIFEDHPLNHQDRIRIGSQEIVFLEEKRYPSRQLRRTGALFTCPACRVPFPSGPSCCPHCGAPVIVETCTECGAPAVSGVDVCGQCGAPINDRGEATIPVELGGGSAGWTALLVTEVIQKAIAAGRYEQAASMLQDKIDEYERGAGKRAGDIAALIDVSGFNAVLANRLREPQRIRWIVERWCAARAPMPVQIFDELVAAGADWLDLRAELGPYLEVLEQRDMLTTDEQPLLSKLRSIVSGADSP